MMSQYEQLATVTNAHVVARLPAVTGASLLAITWTGLPASAAAAAAAATAAAAV